jgi:hypothetical protein
MMWIFRILVFLTIRLAIIFWPLTAIAVAYVYFMYVK